MGSGLANAELGTPNLALDRLQAHNFGYARRVPRGEDDDPAEAELFSRKQEERFKIRERLPDSARFQRGDLCKNDGSQPGSDQQTFIDG